LSSSLRSALYRGSVSHVRLAGDVRHGFRYGVYLHLIDLDELEELDRRLRLFGHRRRRPVSFHDADYRLVRGRARGPEHGRGELSLREEVAAFLRGEGVEPPGGRIELLTHCRVLGYVFNPVSFFYCYDPGGALRVVIAQVNNTFGERYPYVLPVEDGTTVFRRKKLMHVSPFFSLAGTYEFDLPAPAERLRARVDLTREGRTVLAARMDLERVPLSDATLARSLVVYPLIPLKVITAIHLQALRLWIKGTPVFHQPPFDPEAARREPA